MPVKNHAGTPHAVFTMDGGVLKRCKVYVMGPSGLMTIDPVVIFTPPAGGYEAEGYYQVQQALACSMPATWTFTLPSGVTADVANGGTTTNVTFTLTSGSPSKPLARTVNFNVTGTSNGVTASFNITLNALSDF